MNVVRFEPRYRPAGMLGHLYNRDPAAASDWRPAVDIREEDECYLLTADLPGVNPDNIEITLDDSVLTIKGSRASVDDETAEGYRRTERISGSFLRRFTLPDTANGEEIDARTSNGVLEVSIAKQARLQPRKIEVQSA